MTYNPIRVQCKYMLMTTTTGAGVAGSVGTGTNRRNGDIWIPILLWYSHSGTGHSRTCAGTTQ